MEKETLKSLRAKAKELRSKVSSAPLSKATPDQLRSEIVMLERAVKAEEKALERKALKEASKLPEKKKITSPPVKAVTVVKAPVKKDDREKELAKREKALAKKEKLMMQMKMETEDSPSGRNRRMTPDTSDSDDY